MQHAASVNCLGSEGECERVLEEVSYRDTTASKSTLVLVHYVQYSFTMGQFLAKIVPIFFLPASAFLLRIKPKKDD